MDRIVYLIGAGATLGEMEHQGIEGHLTMPGIGENVLRMSKNIGGKYSELHDNFALLPDIDIELIMSLLEGYASSEFARFKDVRDELRKLFRVHLISTITGGGVEANLSSSLLHIHEKYGPHMGTEGEELVGVLTINYDSIFEKAYHSVYGGVNLGFPFNSDIYRRGDGLPPLLKLHGSFNWKINGDTLDITEESGGQEYMDDYSGWIPPSVYKKPEGVIKNIWNAAAGLLGECSKLRVVGSSLRNEDFALLSLVFTSQFEKNQVFDIELIVPDEDATGSEENRWGIIQRLSFLGRMINFSNLDVYPRDHVSTGNVFKEWIGMKLTEIERNMGASISGDAFLGEKLWKGV